MNRNSDFKSYLRQSIIVVAVSVSANTFNMAASAELNLGSGFLTEPVARAHQISVEGDLDGPGRIRFDPNTCELNEFGDPQTCTEIAANVVHVKFQPLPTPDPNGRNRRLYKVSAAEIAGNRLPKGIQLSLVAPTDAATTYRLIVDTGRRRQVILLEPIPPSQPPADLCRTAEYSAVQQNGKVKVTARGQHPTAGWKTDFEQLPQRIYPPEFKLVCQSPDGPAAQVISPFETSVEFTASGIVRRVTITDARGRHRVPVTQKR